MKLFGSVVLVMMGVSALAQAPAAARTAPAKGQGPLAWTRVERDGLPGLSATVADGTQIDIVCNGEMGSRLWIHRPGLTVDSERTTVMMQVDGQVVPVHLWVPETGEEQTPIEISYQDALLGRLAQARQAIVVVKGAGSLSVVFQPDKAAFTSLNQDCLKLAP